MNPLSQHIIVSSMQALPVAIIISKRLRLTQKSLAPVNQGVSNNQAEPPHVRTIKLTPIPTDFGGYSHGGLNE